MGIKEKMLERIEKNSIKVNVRGENIYLKQSGMFKEWHVIYPPVNPETSKWDITNLIFGGKSNAVRTFIVGVLILLLIFGVSEIVKSYNFTMSNPIVQACLNMSGVRI